MKNVNGSKEALKEKFAGAVMKTAQRVDCVYWIFNQPQRPAALKHTEKNCK